MNSQEFRDQDVPRFVEGDVPKWVFDGPTASSCSALGYYQVVVGKDQSGLWWWRIETSGGSDYATAWNRRFASLTACWKQALRALRNVLEWDKTRAWPTEACWRRVGSTPDFPVEDEPDGPDCLSCPSTSEEARLTHENKSLQEKFDTLKSKYNVVSNLLMDRNLERDILKKEGDELKGIRDTLSNRVIDLETGRDTLAARVADLERVGVPKTVGHSPGEHPKTFWVAEVSGRRGHAPLYSKKGDMSQALTSDIHCARTFIAKEECQSAIDHWVQHGGVTTFHPVEHVWMILRGPSGPGCPECGRSGEVEHSCPELPS